ncbi:hypothetical protein [Marinimicrobium sp. ABcell2]|uniref:hypothetical protein n=1 Tax=Marinimicrobium sp. ABcell2 TaxID=3069751 RepID=UPI0027B0BC3C|nr:hypothetical protein [Marinimicrobium sp. ABcell2]MDQ2075870.1 hypothetical protein [Marinimicrobium sp. ABcell2]
MASSAAVWWIWSVNITAEADTWNVPTLSLVKHLAAGEDPERIIEWPEMRYMPEQPERQRQSTHLYLANNQGGVYTAKTETVAQGVLDLVRPGDLGNQVGHSVVDVLQAPALLERQPLLNPCSRPPNNEAHQHEWPFFCCGA